MKGNIPLGGIFDIRPHMKRAVIGGMLSSHELMQVASTIHVSRQMKRFIEDFAEEDASIPFLLAQVEKIIVLAELEESINNAIDDNGEVLDSASETLRTFQKSATNKRSASQRKTRKNDPFIKCAKDALRCDCHHSK